MGLGDKLKDAKEEIKRHIGSVGNVTGSDFPADTVIKFDELDGDAAMRFLFKNGEEYIVTHDKVKSAEVLAMGVIDIRNNTQGGTTTVYGTKYKVALNDGKVAILTVGLGNTLYKVEHIIF